MQTDLLIIGSGIAGCAAALAAAERGLRVMLLTKAPDPRESTATAWAQGGIIYKGEGDSVDLLADDIFRAGVGIGFTPAIRQLAALGPQYVEEYLLGKVNVPFDRGREHELDITDEGAHSVRRQLAVGNGRSSRTDARTAIADCRLSIASAIHVGQQLARVGGGGLLGVADRLGDIVADTGA